MTRAEYEALDLAVRRHPGGSYDEAPELRQTLEELTHKRNEEYNRRARWYATYNASLTGLRSAHGNQFGSGAIKTEATMDANELHGSIE